MHHTFAIDVCKNEVSRCVHANKRHAAERCACWIRSNDINISLRMSVNALVFIRTVDDRVPEPFEAFPKAVARRGARRLYVPRAVVLCRRRSVRVDVSQA